MKLNVKTMWAEYKYEMAVFQELFSKLNSAQILGSIDCGYRYCDMCSTAFEKSLNTAYFAMHYCKFFLIIFHCAVIGHIVSMVISQMRDHTSHNKHSIKQINEWNIFQKKYDFMRNN